MENKEYKVIHKAATRGHFNHGWLETNHTFSFADYYDAERIHFGVLRVINDDIIDGGMGFGTHPHDNMEIITIPLEGDLEHKDNMGNSTVIRHGDIQVMSAGTGIFHSEFNHNKDQKVKLLQIWVFPNKKGVEPRYGQISLDVKERVGRFQQILSPYSHDEGVWIHQNAWFHIADIKKGNSLEYSLKDKSNGIYVFVIKGEVEADGEELKDRDGMGIHGKDNISFKAVTDNTVLVMEVPMFN